MKRKNLIRVAGMMMAVTMLVGSLAGCGGSKNKGENNKKTEGKVVNLAMGAEPDNLDASKNMDDGKALILKQVQETLVNLGENGTIEAGGAEKYEISEDGLTYTFVLKENKYSDGTQVKAQDYANGMIRTLAPETASQYASFFYPIAGAEEYNLGTGTKEDVGIACPDDKTLVVTLSEPVPYFIQMFTHSSAIPVPEELTEGEKKIQHTVQIKKE